MTHRATGKPDSTAPGTATPPPPDAPAPDPDRPRPSASLRLAQRAIRRSQHRLATMLGVDEERRTDTVIAMLENNVRRAPGYWIQLFLSMGIATLGLVLGSTAVVIGAMLVSPLMGPILELGMGFAVGSALLVLRAALRLVLSVAGVIGGAAFLTVLLPYHEVTAEIAARTAPTALDLLVAVFCALAAAYTTVRQGSDTTAAAAGTAIGISLVPPLCTAGFGVGTLSSGIAGGATLLFVANFSAILVFAVATFLVLGYNMVDARALEARFGVGRRSRTDRMASRAHSLLGAMFGSRYGLVLRLLVPLLFLAMVYVPLGRALDEVAWEVRTRESIRRILKDEAGNAVQTAVSVERQGVSVQLMTLGTSETAAALQRRLESRIAAASGATPDVSVTAVPDMAALNAAAVSRAPPAAVPVPIRQTRDRLQQALAQEWPALVAGPLVSWEIVTASSGPTTVTLRHAGPALGAAAESLLARNVSARLAHPVAVRGVMLPLAPIVAERNDTTWLAVARDVLRNVERADSAQRIVACVTRPARSARQALATRAFDVAIDSSTAARESRVISSAGPRWSIRVAVGACQ